MVNKIEKVELIDNQFIFDGRQLSDYEINEPLRMPDDKIVIIVPSALTTQTLDAIHLALMLARPLNIVRKSGFLDSSDV